MPKSIEAVRAMVIWVAYVGSEAMVTPGLKLVLWSMYVSMALLQLLSVMMSMVYAVTWGHRNHAC